MTELTIGELSRRTRLSIKAIREYEALGLIYSAGFDDERVRGVKVLPSWVVTDPHVVGVAT